MAQHSGSISNDTGANVRADVNNALAAINSNNSGSSDPSTTFSYQFYADTGDKLEMQQMMGLLMFLLLVD